MQNGELRRLAGRTGTSPALVVFAAFCALVFRYTDETICSMGVHAGDDRKAQAPSRATDVRALRIDFTNDPTFEELLRASTAAVCGAIGGPPVGTDERLFALGFGSLDDMPQPRPFNAIWATVADDGRRLALCLTYDPTVCESAAIESLATHFSQLFQELLTAPETPVSRPPMMNDEERRAVLSLGRGTRSPYERGATIHALFSLQARATPDAVAVAGLGGALSYSDLERRANQLSHHLRSLGVSSGTAVGIFVERSTALPVLLLAILKAGGFYVPLDLSYPRERLEFMIDDAGILFVVGERAAGNCRFPDVTVVDLDRDAALIARQPSDPPLTLVDPEALAYIAYTSGSTGRPKGVAVMHRGVVRLVRGTDYIEVRSDDVFLQLAPVAFDASTFELWAPLLNGAQLAIPRPGLLAMPELGETIAEFGVTVVFLTTSLFQKLVDAHLPTLGTLRLLLTGGEVASARHMLRFLETLPSCELMAVYGPTENTTFSTWCELSDAAAIGANVAIGRPIANASAYVLDRHREPVPIGAVGELWVGGDGVAQGYINLPELTRERFVHDPFSNEAPARLYRTGDRARLRRDGLLDFLGRSDDQVKIRGHRVELGEIESVLQAHPAVLDAAVVVTHDSAEKALVAFVLGSTGADVKESELRAHLAARLPAYMLPNRFEVVDRLPQHASGKLDRIALARMASEPARPARAERPPPPGENGSTLQDAVAAVWRDVIGGNRVPGCDENFFDAGGDSLRLLTVHERLQREFSVALSVVDLFEHSTVRKLAGLISRSQVRA